MGITRETKKIDIRLCTGCNAIFLKNRWQHGINIVKFLENEAKTKEDYQVMIKVIHELCKNCSSSKSGYFEGILQLRNKKNEDFDSVVDEVLKLIGQQEGAFIAKTVELKTGIDLYLSSSRLLQGIAKKLHVKYGGILKTSQSLFSRDRQTSKNVYRVTVLLRLPDFNRGDILGVDKRIMLLKNIKRNTLIGLDLRTYKNMRGNSEKALLLMKKKDLKKTIVSRLKPHLEVIHPETFQSTRVENPIPTKKEQVYVVEIEQKLYLVPA